jgi:hypothetical protein
VAGADYDGIGGVMRLLKAGEKPDTFAIEVVTYHAAVENELERVINTLVERPDELFTTSPKLTFGHKANLLRAVWQGDPAQADILHEVLYRFQMVRNAVAHPDSKAIKGCMAGLAQAYRRIDQSIGDEVSILEAAQGICLFMEDGSNVTQLKAIFDGLDHLVNKAMPQALGVRDADRQGDDGKAA